MHYKLLTFLVFICLVSAKKKQGEVVLDINKLSAYVGETGLQIRCHAEGQAIINPTWMIMEFEGFQSKRPMVYLFKKGKKDAIEWGQEYNVTQQKNHIAVHGHLEGSKSFLQLDFSHVACEDGGRYTCSYGGLDKKGRLRKFSMSGDFIAQTTDGGPPTISVNGKVAKSFETFNVSPGEKFHLVCEGDVGKPLIPIFWIQHEFAKPDRVLTEQDGVKQGLQMIPDDNRCSFRSQVHLYYEMKNNIAALTCQIAFRKVHIYLLPH